MEMWKDIEDLPGYSVSNKGRVMKNDTGQIMVLGKNNGYVRIVVAKHVHRLVAKAFLDDPENKKHLWVDHIDGNRSNNDVSNLRWVTPSENRLAFGHEQRTINKQRKVRATHLDGEEIIFESRQACAKYFGTSDSEVVYNKRYQRHSSKKRTNPNAHDKKGWIFEKVEDIV
ncbi:NUMOD4 motif-containing HNH endonuclease [Enterococcus sp. 22-H-5-01]|uniref:NUMOD4 motif-containing HNH endonuclease n=1 Tax=Enterococcus sp. 22-H-5-01 TaxID=3418555 RepID=UPI003D01296A